MGKKRTKRNKRKKNVNVLENLSNEKKPSDVFGECVNKEKIASDNCSPLVIEKKLLDLQLPKHNLLPSVKENFNTLKSNPGVSLSENYEDTTEKHESFKTKDRSQYVSHEDTVQNLYVENFYPANHATCVNKSPREMYTNSVNKHKAGKSSQRNNSFSESDEEFLVFNSDLDKSVKSKRANPEIYFQNEMPESFPDHGNDQFFLKRYPGEENFESDGEYSTDYFPPVFDDQYPNKTSKSIIPCGEDWEENFHVTPDKDCDYRKKYKFPEAGYSGLKNSEESFESKKLKEISDNVTSYKNSKDYFSDVYHTWLSDRKNTLEKLRTLYAEIHHIQLNYNKSQTALREVSLNSRKAKYTGNLVFGVLASFSAFVSEAASGIVSVAQAFNVDSYQRRFQEIMEHDSEITQKLYKTRSQCIEKYHNVEEVMRKFHSDTFNSTLGKISDTLEVDKYWAAMKKAYGNDDMPKLMDIVNKFFGNACQSEKLEEVNDSIQSYVSNNPAALEACKSAGRATHEALDTLTVNMNRNILLKGINFHANLYLMEEDVKEVERLRSTTGDEDSPQTKLESQIDDAIYSLELEMKEINDIYCKLFKIYIDSDDDDGDIFSLY